jgi:predicted ATPase/DNA-binding SARP family transcriptional activator
MSSVTLVVLGDFSLFTSTGIALHFPTEKVRALLLYLVLEPQAHRREVLAELLWPDTSHHTGLKNLRMTLYRLRQMLAEIDPSLPEHILSINHQSIQLKPDLIAVDALQVQSLIRDCEQHHHSTITECAHCQAQLQTAVDSYRGELSPYLAVADAPLFEEWLSLQREALHTMVLLATHTLTVGLIARGDYQLALTYAQQLITLDQYREESHRQLMLIFYYLKQPQRALKQYHHYAQLLQQELSLDPTAELRTLKEHIQSGHSGDPQLQTSAISTVAPPAGLPLASSLRHNNLPIMLNQIVGRERELADLSTLITSSQARLVSLIGMGGIGKTRLAIELGHSNAALFRHGVLFIPLASLSNSAALITLLLTSLELEVQDESFKQICAYLRDKQLLLVLDNAEHLLDGLSDICLRLLEAVPHLKIVVTSREPLQLRGEYLYRVLALDDAQRTSDGTDLPLSVALFVQCAQRMQADFYLDDTNRATVLTICQLLQGVPLAIELAAAWVTAYSLDQIATAISQNLDFLAFDWRRAPVRQQSMRAIFTWSWNLLQADEQRALCCVALFQGDFSQEALLEIAQISPILLLRLYHTSFLHYREYEGGRRYSMHGLLRQYALEQFATDTQRLALEARHCSYYLSFVASREHRLMHKESRLAAAEIWTEIDNIRQAWVWAFQHRSFKDIDICLDALYQFYVVTGLFTDRVSMFGLAYQAVSSADFQMSEDPCVRRIYAKILGCYSMALARAFQNEQAIQIAQEAIEHKQSSDLAAILAHMAWSFALLNQGKIIAAREQIECALELNQEAQTKQYSEFLGTLEWIGYFWSCTLNLALSDYQRALDHAYRGQAICDSLGQQTGKIMNLLVLGELALTSYDLTPAQSYYKQAQQLAITTSSHTTESRILLGLGETLRLQGKYAEALQTLEHALAVSQKTKDQWLVYLVTTALVRLFHLMGEYEQAQFWYGQLKHQDQALLTPSHRISASLAMSSYLQEVGHLQEALELAERSWKLARVASHTYNQAHCLVVLGHARLLVPDTDPTEAYHQALQICDTIQNSSIATEAWAGLALVALRNHDLQAARHASEMILIYIDKGQRVGLDEPFFCYQVCLRVLYMLADERAKPLLQVYNLLLETYMTQLNDTLSRTTFFSRVGANQPL